MLGQVVLSLFAAYTMCAAQPGEGNVREVSPSECMPGPGDYTFLWWENGWNHNRPAGDLVLCVQTGYYGLAIDAQHMKLLHCGAIDDPLSADGALTQSSDVITSLPEGALRLAIWQGDIEYRCVRGAVGWDDWRDWLNFPVRIIESGRFLQRFDIQRLEFENDTGERLPVTARLEITAWPEQVLMRLFVTPEADLHDTRVEMVLEGHRRRRLRSRHERYRGGRWEAGREESGEVGLRFTPGPSNAQENQPVVEAHTVGLESQGVDVAQDGLYGWHRIDLPRGDWSVAEDPDHLERITLRVTNPDKAARTVPLLFAKDYSFPGVTGMTPMLRDREGRPTGIPVQLSKNWHRQKDVRLLHEGPWFHCLSLLRMPPRSTTELEFAITYARWGGVPAASHAQLCLIGWGANQLWDQAAIGSWGESICYEPDGCQRRCMIDDVRPLMATSMNPSQPQWTWTTNVGGGDFLVYYDADGRYQHLKRVRTHYAAHGPNLTEVTYAGVTADDAIGASMTVSLPRCDDITRVFHRFRYDVLKPVHYSRLAFYQLGADRYNEGRSRTFAIGNETGAVEEVKPKCASVGYERTAMLLEGRVPWVSLHDSAPPDDARGAWANRGLIVRSWKARLGGRDGPVPRLAIYSTRDDGAAGALAELGPAGLIEWLQAGDFVEAEIELVVFPMSGDDYYGPNEGLRAALQTGGNTRQMVHREAVGNDLEVSVDAGRLLQPYPVLVRLDGKQQTSIEVTGGLGYVPVSFTGLESPVGWMLMRDDGDGPAAVDQSVHGNDFWQTGYDAATGRWRRTYNVSLDTPDDARPTVALEFRNAERAR